MKKYFIALLTLSVFSFMACQDFLEEEVVTSLTQDYYKTKEGLESLCKGSYKILRYKGDYNQGEYLFGASNDIEVYSWSNADRIVNGSYSPGWVYSERSMASFLGVMRCCLISPQ